MHLDAACQQRDMRFGASVWLDTVPQVVTTLAAPLAKWLGDYQVMLYVVIGQVVMMTLVSHLVAERPYRWAWDRVIIGRMLRFGWPLLINGLLMFAIFQGDKAIVGRGVHDGGAGLVFRRIWTHTTSTTSVRQSIAFFLAPTSCTGTGSTPCFSGAC